MCLERARLNCVLKGHGFTRAAKRSYPDLRALAPEGEKPRKGVVSPMPVSVEGHGLAKPVSVEEHGLAKPVSVEGHGFSDAIKSAKKRGL